MRERKIFILVDAVKRQMIRHLRAQMAILALHATGSLFQRRVAFGLPG